MNAEYAGVAALVTGADGFIGSWLAERLLASGARVIVPKRAPSGSARVRGETVSARCERIELDLLEPASLVRALNEHQVQVVFHLAAQTLVGEANRAPFTTFETNVRGTYNLLEACRSMAPGGDPPRAVVASSYHVYGQHGGQPYNESFGLRPRYPYDVSKACADALARSYALTYDLPIAVTRLANVYGGGDLNLSRLVPAMALALVRGERPVIRSDGTPERDFLYVEDAVEAYLAVAASLERPELRGRAWNAGGGDSVSVAEVARLLIAASGQELELEIQGRANPRDEIDRQYLDSSAIRAELGWIPRRGLDEGLALAYEWYERNLAEEALTFR